MYEYRKLNAQQKAELATQRKAKGYPWHSPPHSVRDQPLYLITATCYEHKPHLHKEARRQQIQELLLKVFTAADQEIRAWVILPNHYHLLVQTTDFDLLGPLIRKVHGPKAVEWNREDNMPGRKVWYRYTDRAIRSERHYYTTLNYIHYNPVKHKYCSSPYDWPYSSVHWYVEHYGRNWLRELWTTNPLHSYGEGWDDL